MKGFGTNFSRLPEGVHWSLLNGELSCITRVALIAWASETVKAFSSSSPVSISWPFPFWTPVLFSVESVDCVCEVEGKYYYYHHQYWNMELITVSVLLLRLLLGSTEVLLLSWGTVGLANAVIDPTVGLALGSNTFVELVKFPSLMLSLESTTLLSLAILWP